jgi:hypothetical protein
MAASLGRWTQRDSIAGSIANPNAMDRYVYAGDSPVNLTDVSGLGPPTGLLTSCEIDLGGVAAGVFSAAGLLLGMWVPPVEALLAYAAYIVGVVSLIQFANNCTPLGQFLP